MLIYTGHHLSICLFCLSTEVFVCVSKTQQTEQKEENINVLERYGLVYD